MVKLSDKTILTQEESGLKGIDGDFVPAEFRTLVEQQGYEVIYETMLMCPCKDEGGDHRMTCKNCGGSGFLFVNPIRTKMILTGIGLDKQLEKTGSLDLGMMHATPVSLLKMAWMDKITVMDGETVHNEVLYPSIDDVYTGNYFSLTHYDMRQVDWAGLYDGDEQEVTRLVIDEDFFFSGNRFILTDKHNGLVDPRISIRYRHYPTFHVWQVANEIRSVKTSSSSGRQNNFMPQKAVVMRAHMIEELENFDVNRLFDNSWLSMDCNLTDQELSQLELLVRNTSTEKLFDTLTPLQKSRMKPLFGRVMDTPLSSTITFEAPTVVIS